MTAEALLVPAEAYAQARAEVVEFFEKIGISLCALCVAVCFAYFAVKKRNNTINGAGKNI